MGATWFPTRSGLIRTDTQGIYVVIEFEDDEGFRSTRVHPSQLEALR